MQQIQIIKLGDLGHPSRQRKIVRRILEERILRDLHFVKVNVRMRFGQPDRLRIRDEVNIVSSIGQLNTKLGGHDAAAFRDRSDTR